MARRLGPGMWVKSPSGQVGIIFNHPRGLEFHEVKENGETGLVIPIDQLSDYTQASRDDIPESRRPTEEMSRALGYLPPLS